MRKVLYYTECYRHANVTDITIVEQLSYDLLCFIAAFLSLLRELGDAYLALQTYDIKNAVDKFENIPYHQYKTGWVLAELGKAYLELSEHQKVRNVMNTFLKIYGVTLLHRIDKVIQCRLVGRHSTLINFEDFSCVLLICL